MALHKHLPIYKLAYDLLDVALDLVRNLPRDVKHSLGDKLHRECIEMLVLVGRANAATDKVPFITELIERLEVAELMLRLSHDKRFISHKQYARAVELTGRLGQQAGGWRKHSAQQHPTPPAAPAFGGTAPLFTAASPAA
jgi:hypothetical protein